MPDHDGELRHWRAIIENYKSEFDTMVGTTRDLGDRMRAQSDRYVLALARIFNERDVLMDAAYEVLVEFVNELLQYESGTDEIGSRGVLSLPRLVASFKALAEYCEKVIDDENVEAAESMQETGETAAVIGNIRALKARMRSDEQGLERAVSSAEDNFNVDHEHHMQAREALSNARDRQSGFLYDLFGDDGIDAAVRTTEQNENDWHVLADAAWAFWDRLRNLKGESWGLFNCDTENLVNTLESLAKDMKSNYEKVGLARKSDNDCWVAARVLQYHVTTQTEYTSRDDALRHVIKLLHTINKTIDDDVHVKAFKDAIEANIQGKLGEDKAKDLHQEKTFLALPDGLDI